MEVLGALSPRDGSIDPTMEFPSTLKDILSIDLA